ncbi:hypothetical protein LMH87_002586 [Akanthomyces muscarius]|uniref:BOD1/SHG1 domain-containing protein n=1 Tax=Akanthomyces muscarius TaxID=2231603 RepID=A0A9W8Q800_AKAMU|nr:hypothetical protein LMH87_002586 [Akanthomyces muscarius]KAJ4148099.1 hypothetical protein LMH87_002586 [Akanthomyces muscarius]
MDKAPSSKPGAGVEPRKYKASDLPLPSATRAAIESLAHAFKKEGAYDDIRKHVWDKFEASDYEAQVTKAILEVAEKEVERNPQQLLTLDRRKAAALIDGALERSGVYQKAEEVLGKLIDVGTIEERIREIRRAELGPEAAEAEKLRGSKTDEDYAADTAARRAERARIRDELRQKEEAIAEEKRRIAREERKREEKERELAEIKRQDERDERRRKREADHRDRRRDTDSQAKDKEPKELSKEDLERLEQEALDDLIRESRSTRSRPEVEIDSALAPPPRKTALVSAIDPIRRESGRGSVRGDSRTRRDRGDSSAPRDERRKPVTSPRPQQVARQDTAAPSGENPLTRPTRRSQRPKGSLDFAQPPRRQPLQARQRPQQEPQPLTGQAYRRSVRPLRPQGSGRCTFACAPPEQEP